jgi:hypothetical protein
MELIALPYVFADNFGPAELEPLVQALAIGLA